MVLSNTLLLVLGLVLLIKGSDFFVKAAASIAKKRGVSEFVIGLTLVAIATSIPELVSSVIAAIKQESDIVIGNVVGSNIANIGLIVGLAAAIALIKTREEMLKRDGYIMLFAALIFYLFIINGKISRVEALLFLLLYVAYTVFLLEEKPKLKDNYGFKEFITYFFELKYLATLKRKVILGRDKRKKENPTTEARKIKELSQAGLIRDFTVLIGSGFAIVFGANYLVDEAIFFADFFDVPKTVIGITLVAVGTSLPELGVAISAARKGYGNIAVGNVIGSNIANIFLIIGVSAMIAPLSVIKSTIFYTAPSMIFMSLLLLIFIKSKWEISRKEGIVFLILYTLFLTVLFLKWL
ncbi:MAG: calcium/sodium antiporter [archaeon]|nr:calcium/sodium antiporter [archaeon]